VRELKSPSKAQRLEEYLRQNQLTFVSEDLWRKLLTLFAPVSERYLRDLLHRAGLPIEQPFGGVRQSSFDELEASLSELEHAYSAAVANHDHARAKACRRVVIEAKDHARMASRNPKVAAEKREQKREMVEWLLVWLENPGIFESWAALRKKALTDR